MSYLEKFDYGLNATQTTEVDVLYEKDNNEFKSIRNIRDFNDRKCKCCNCDDDADWYCFLEDNDEKNEDNSDSDSENCVCTCLYPSYVENPLRLTDIQILRLIDYLKTKNVSVHGSDFKWDNWSNLDDYIVKKFEVTDETVKKFKQEYEDTKLKINSINYNILRILSGMGSLNTSS